MTNLICEAPSLFNLKAAHPSWQPCLHAALQKMDALYLERLTQQTDWLPGPQHIFNAFSLPVDAVQYVLFGESPYPRAESANGYAFWDQSVQALWSDTGLSKSVNRATSLRNILKMLLIAENLLQPTHTTQDEIAKIDKSRLVQTNEEFFKNFLNHGFLLLNASLVLQSTAVRQDAKAWLPFIQAVMNYLLHTRPTISLVLLGNIAKVIDGILDHSPGLKKIYAEHPYNLSFITNPEVIRFFKPFHLLRKTTSSMNVG